VERLFSPLDNATSVAGYPVTPQAARIAVEEASERPYEQAVRHLADRHEIVMGKELLEHLTRTVGEYWLTQDGRHLQQARADHTAPPEQLAASECLTFADGVKIHTDGSWRETRGGTVRSRTAEGASHKSSIVRLCALQGFGEDLWRHACEMGYRSASQVDFIADGSHWLWSIAEQYFQRAVKIADFWHVCENVCACAKAFFGEGTEQSRQWSTQVCERLRTGQVQAALEQVEALNPRSSPSRREAKHALVAYLTNNRDRMGLPPL
jgi:hypothetical protein